MKIFHAAIVLVCAISAASDFVNGNNLLAWLAVFTGAVNALFVVPTHAKAGHGFECWRIGNWIICYRSADDKRWRWLFGLI